MTTTTRTQFPFYAVRVTVRDSLGQTFTRDYVRGEQRMGRITFRAFALGDFLMTVVGEDDGISASWHVEEIDFETVRQNRLYHHTTH